MTEAAHILVVDDEPEMREAIAEYLDLRGYRVTMAASGEEMKRVLDAGPADLVLLDLGLPGEDGLALTSFLKSKGDIGVIIVTAHGETEDRVAGLELGADDYVVKPFNFRELLARIRSVLRRHGGGPAAVAASAPTSVNFGEWVFDRTKRELRDAQGNVPDLSTGELDLLDVLTATPCKPVSRDELLAKTANRDWDPYDRSIDVRITRLRRKLEIDPARPKIIRTVRGIGYMLKQGG